jgi:hypothetical protein
MDKKILAIAVIVIIVVAAVASWQLLLQGGKSIPPLTLTVVGADGTEKVLNEKDLAELTSVTSDGGYKTSGGIIATVGSFTGVSVLELCDLVGGITSADTLTVTAADGYSMVFTYSQVNGEDFTTYDPVTGSEKTATQPLTLIIYYFYNDTASPSDVGPLRMAVVGSEGLLTEGHFWVKQVVKIEVTSDVRDWSVLVSATADLHMDRQSFTADLNHFGINYTDSSGNVWTGTALWRWVSWSNYNGGVTNDSLDAGYSVKLISGDGYSAEIDDSRVKDNDNIIVAALLNGEVLPDPYWPLTLVGSDVSSQEKVKNIVEIQIVLSSTSPSASPTPSPSSSSSPTPTPSSSPDWSVTINGTTAVTMAKATFETLASQDSQTYTDSSTTWVGTPLYRVVTWATSNGVISSSALNSGYVVKVIASDGYTRAFNDSRVGTNANILVANKANGTALASPYSPLTLTGSDLSGKDKVKGISQIQILPLQHLQLTLVAANGTQVVLYSNDLAALTSYTANGGTRSSSGTLSNYGSYTGVPILTLLDLVGGVTSSNTVKVTASDDYVTTYTYNQLHGQDITAYDSTGTAVTPTQPLTMIVAYFLNGANLESGTGPLRTITVGSEGYYTTGSFSSKMAVKIEII